MNKYKTSTKKLILIDKYVKRLKGEPKPKEGYTKRTARRALALALALKRRFQRSRI